LQGLRDADAEVVLDILHDVLVRFASLTAADHDQLRVIVSIPCMFSALASI